ncbi:hypothetical protein ACP275_07G085000 [Erythranthe tilingii]
MHTQSIILIILYSSMTRTNPTNLLEFTVKKSRTHKSRAPSKNPPLSIQNISDQPSKTLKPPFYSEKIIQNQNLHPSPKPHDKLSNNIGSKNLQHKVRSQGCSSSTVVKKRTRDQSLKNSGKRKLTKEDEEKYWLDQPLSEFRISGEIPDLEELNAVDKNTCQFLGINNPDPKELNAVEKNSCQFLGINNPDLEELNAVEKNTCQLLWINNPGCEVSSPRGLSVIPGPVPDNLGDIKYDDFNFDSFLDMSDDDDG